MQQKFNQSICFTLVLLFCTLGLIPEVKGEQRKSNSYDAQELILAQGNKDNEKEEQESQLQGIPLEVNEIAEQITVTIESQTGNGSGVIFAQKSDKADKDLFVYYVLTAKHVVEKDREYTVITIDNESHSVIPNQIKRFDDSDLAVVSFKSKSQYDTARFGDYQFGFNEESWVFVSGWANSSQFDILQFSAGKVAGKETGILLVKDDLSFAQDNGYELVYTNLSEQGMSGGAVLDTSGRVIGIHASAEGERYKLADKLQLGFSLGIPVRTFLNSSYAQDLVKQGVEIKTTKERLDIDPFTQPKLSREDLDSIQNNLTKIETPAGSSDETEWLNYGNQLWRLSRYPQAIQAFDRALAKKSDFYQAHYGKGLANYNQGNYQEAVAEFEQATKIQPDFYPAWYRQSLSLLSLKEYERAQSAIERSLELQPDNVALYILQGEALQNLSQPEEAITAYNKAIASDASSVVLVRRGSLQRNIGKSDLAIQDFKQAITNNPKYIEAYLNRGLTYYQLGDYAQAINDFNHVINLDYQDPRGYLGRGLVNYQRQDLTQSTTDFYFAWQLYQENQNSSREVSNVSSQPDKYASIPIDFKTLLQADSTPGHLDLGRGVALALMGEQEKAIAHLQQANSFFQTQKDNSSYQLTQALLKQVNQEISNN